MRQIIRSSARLALLWQITAGLLLGGDLLLTILLYPQNTFKIPFLFLFLITGVYLVLLGTIGGQYARQRRFLKQLFQGRVPTTPAPTLPDPALGLPPGGSITLHYQRRSSRLVKALLNYSVRLLVSTVCFELILLYFTPDALPTFFGLMTGVPLALQWLLLALPPLLWVLLSLHTLRTSLRTTLQTFTLDDRGITRRSPWAQDETIAWHEISACVRLLFATGDQLLGSYLVYGPNGYLEITLQPLAVLSGRQNAADYHFTPDPATYRVLAERMLATILARTGVPLRVVSTAFYSRGGQRSSYTIGVAAQDVARQPEAPLSYQPPAYALEWARSYPGSYGLPVTQDLLMVQPVGGARTVLGWLVRGLLIVVLGIFLFVVLIQLVDLPTALLITLLLLLPGFFFLTRAVRHMRPRAVEIIAEPAGLSRKGSGPRLFIPWNQVQAWGVMLPSGRQQQPVYAVLWSGTTLSWMEPERASLSVAQDDVSTAYQAASPGQHTLTVLRSRQRAAYLAAAQALHALIAVRTGQPMRILNQSSTP